MKIVLDAMGGDNAPFDTVKGGIMAVLEFGCDAIFVGDSKQINEILQKEGQLNNPKIEVVHSEQIINMCDEPQVVMREKRNSSMGVAFDLLAQDKADALISAGNTGAVLTGASLIVKRIKGVRRAAIAPTIPTKTVGGSLLVDSGANTECSAEYLEQFALMGSIYCEKAMNRANPKVGLVNNGAESTKGTPVIKETYDLLFKKGKSGAINFIGNIEGRDVAQGTADVIVADGFTGNILLKTYEGVGIFIGAEIKKIFMKNILTKIAGLIMKSSIDDLKKLMDYKEVGGAPMIGIKKPVIKAHGSSNSYAIRSAFKQAITYHESGVIDTIAEKIAEFSEK